MAEYEQQLVNDSNISVDDYINPSFAQSLHNSSFPTDTGHKHEELAAVQPNSTTTEISEDSSEVTDARDFAEQFTEPIHQSKDEQPNNERVVETEQMEEKTADLEDTEPSSGQSEENIENAAFAALHSTNLTENEGSNLSFSNDQPSTDLTEKTLEEKNSINTDDQVAVEDVQMDNEREPENRDEMDNNSNNSKTEEDMKADEVEDEKESAITNVLHTDFNDEALDYSEQDMRDTANDNKSTEVNDETTREQPAEEEKSEDVEEGELQTNLNETVEDEKVTLHGADDEFVEHVKPKPKVIVPVTLKKRVSLTSLNESAEEKAAKRKRRWGSTSINQSSVTISTDSIKKLIPDVKVDASALENVPELDYQEDEEVTEQDSMEIENVEGKNKQSRSGRTVKLDSAKKVILGKSLSSNTVVIDSDSGEVPTTQTRSVHPIRIDDDTEEQGKRERSPSPAKNAPSCYLHIENLVRPYTVNNLKGLIQKTGTIKDNKFWMNNIKSHCYVMLSSEEEANTTREAMHGLRWPSGNPKILKVDFAVMEKMFEDTNGTVGEQPKVVIEIDDKENDSTKEHKEKEESTQHKSRENERKRRNERSEKHATKDVKNKADKADKKREESPAKLLDDLFRKTKATPCIYWLPLTDAQILEKEKKASDGPRDAVHGRRNEETHGRRNEETHGRRNEEVTGRRRSPYRRPPQNRDRSWR
ncbi:apoptotic chromatin condensation inducer in the nucleus-like isoform X2 [Hydractinia symbiolongicarpus]|nr:apoptotic chromatin condensation inducer in the nucleus-like isoform X2 [Hydractinia symbiolongicarpus]